MTKTKQNKKIMCKSNEVHPSSIQQIKRQISIYIYEMEVCVCVCASVYLSCQYLYLHTQTHHTCIRMHFSSLLIYNILTNNKKKICKCL